jgi:hypothetical protein
MLLRAAIKLSLAGADKECTECQRFYKEGLTLSFTRILTDDAVNTWKPDIQLDIFTNSKLLVELCAAKFYDDNLYLLDLLSIVFNPSSKYVVAMVIVLLLWLLIIATVTHMVVMVTHCCHVYSYGCHGYLYGCHGLSYGCHGYSYGCYGHLYGCHGYSYGCYGYSYFQMESLQWT